MQVDLSLQALPSPVLLSFPDTVMAGNLVPAIALGSLCLFLFKMFRQKSNRLPLPPGPKSKPIIGNLLDLPPSGELEWLHWTKHKDLYGPISSVSVLGQTIVIVNDLKVAYELLDRRSAVFSERPVLQFAGVMCGFEDAMAVLRYGDRLKTQRRYLHQCIGTSSAMLQHHPLQELEARWFLFNLLEKRDKLQDQIRAMIGSLALKMSHGYTTERDGQDPLVQLAEEVMSQFSFTGQAGVWMVDILPFLRHVPDWMPGTEFKRIAVQCRRDIDRMVNLPHAFVKQQVASGSYCPSFTSSFLEDGMKSEEDDFRLKYAGFAIYAGAADTTVSAIYSFFLAMLLYPDVQDAAQAELDRAVGSDRLPNFTDRERLPYINALIKETLRWNPVAPLCVPHTASEDSTYNGYFIPQGSVILPNIWWFTHEPSAYKDPMEFKPERFLGDKPEADPYDVVFGFGRRTCPGKELADASLFITMASVLSVFNVRKARNSEGEVIEAVAEYTSGIISHPKEFECSLKPRSDRAAQLIRDAHGELSAEASDVEALARVKW